MFRKRRAVPPKQTGPCSRHHSVTMKSRSDPNLAYSGDVGCQLYVLPRRPKVVEPCLGLPEGPISRGKHGGRASILALKAMFSSRSARIPCACCKITTSKAFGTRHVTSETVVRTVGSVANGFAATILRGISEGARVFSWCPLPSGLRIL